MGESVLCIHFLCSLMESLAVNAIFQTLTVILEANGQPTDVHSFFWPSSICVCVANLAYGDRNKRFS